MTIDSQRVTMDSIRNYWDVYFFISPCCTLLLVLLGCAWKSHYLVIITWPQLLETNHCWRTYTYPSSSDTKSTWSKYFSILVLWYFTETYPPSNIQLSIKLLEFAFFWRIDLSTFALISNVIALHNMSERAVVGKLSMLSSISTSKTEKGVVKCVLGNSFF